MHSYYAESKEKIKKRMNKYLSLITAELENISGKKYAEVFEEIR